MPEPDESGKLVKDINLPALSRKKQGRKALPDNLLRKEILHDIDEEDKGCGCGCTLNRIGEEVSEQLDVMPARIQVLRHIRPKYTRRNCEGVEDDGSSVKFVVSHKNWLFSDTPEDTEASALLYSLIETAKANELEPYTYLRAVLQKLPLASTLQDDEALLPWNVALEY